MLVRPFFKILKTFTHALYKPVQKIQNSNPHDCKKLRNGVKSVKHAASQSSGWESTSVDNASEPAC